VNAESTDKRAAMRAALAIAPGVMFVGVAGGIAFPILPFVGLRAGLSLPFIGLILAANRMARIFASPAVGTLADRLGGRRLLLIGLASQIAVMSLYLMGVVVGHPGAFFLAARLLHGPGSACVFVAAQVLALHAGGARHGGKTAGLVRAAMTTGMPVGLVVGGLLSARFGNRVTFGAAIGAVLVASVLAAALVPDLRAAQRVRTDLRGLLRVMSEPHVLALGALNLATFFSAQGTVLTTLVLLIQARSLTLAGLGTQSSASLVMGVLLLISAAASITVGRLADRYNASARWGVVGLLILAAGLGLTTVVSSPAMLLVSVGLVGCGMGAMNPCLVALLGLFVKPEVRGSAVGAVQLFGDIGGSLGPVVGGALFARSTGAPFWVSALVTGCALPAGLWLARAERHARAQAARPAGTDGVGLPEGEL
jgi:MFS family permease